ncbi:MAG: hypothetical protein Q7S40_27295 [Opitutaceae bacterium]|nr:hypothetical protein [Opitutaceae bacterium]
MHRLPLILCLIALAGSVVSAVLFLRIGNSKQLLELRLADVSSRATRLDDALAASNNQNGALKARLDTAESELGSTKERLAGTEMRVQLLDRDLAAAKNDLASAKSVLGFYESTAKALADEVAALRTDLTEARSSNASPEAVQGYRTTIAELERQLALSRNGAAAPSAAGASTAVFASRAGRATILNVGPENAFVVLNFGSSRGAQLGQTLSVNQGADVVATVLISDVRTNFSIAQVLPDTLRGVLHKGDSAVLVR